MTAASDKHLVTGSIHVANAASVARAGSDAIAAGVSQIDLASVTEADSSGLAVVLQWMREAKQRNQDLAVLNLPASMRSLAAVYGVEDILPQ